MLLKKLNILEDSVIIFFASLGICLLNIIFTSHFISLLFVGLEFILFVKALRNSYYYSLLITIFTFLVIEDIYGFRLFSLSVLSYFIYVFILPLADKFFSSNEVKRQIYAMIFYFYFFIFLVFTSNLDISLFFLVMINIIVDFMILGILL